MTDEAEDSGCTSQDPDDVVSTGGSGNNNVQNNTNSGGLTATVAAASPPSKKSKPSSVESADIPGTLSSTAFSNVFLSRRRNQGVGVPGIDPP